MEKPPRLLLSRLWLQNRVYDVTLNSIVFAWKETEPNRKRAPGTNWNTCKAAGSHSVPVCEVIAVQETAEENQKSKKNVGKWHRVPRSPEESYQPPAFTVFYVERTRQHRWRCRSVTFHCPDWGLCQQWIQTIEEQLTLLTYRPKRLLVYINPFGGKQQGKRIYEQKVAPIFSRASISTDVIVTERANHARDHLKSEADLKKYDGVVCVGGDGMFSEIVHGLVWRTQSDSGVDQNCPEETLVPCDIRIGIIPAGSTDCICYATVGANDPVTSALHIIVGDAQPLDVCSVHHHNTFLRYSISLLGYGFYGDLLTDSEKKRWMGPTRYDFSGVKTFLSHHYYEGTVSFLPAIDNASSPRDKFKCRSGCHVCQHSDHLPLEDKPMCNEEEEEEEEQDGVVESGHKDVWRVIRGKFVAINAVSMSCACPRSPKGLSPAAHLSDGTTDLILVHKCSRLDFLRHLLRHTNKNDQFDHSFVEVHRVRRFRFMPKHQEADPEELDLCERGGEGEGGGGGGRGGGRGRGRRLFGQICRDHPACSTCAPTHSTWSCDGETLPHTAIQVGVHCQLIKLFARGIEEQPVFEDSSAVCSA